MAIPHTVYVFKPCVVHGSSVIKSLQDRGLVFERVGKSGRDHFLAAGSRSTPCSLIIRKGTVVHGGLRLLCYPPMIAKTTGWSWGPPFPRLVQGRLEITIDKLRETPDQL